MAVARYRVLLKAEHGRVSRGRARIEVSTGALRGGLNANQYVRAEPRLDASPPQEAGVTRVQRPDRVLPHDQVLTFS